MRSGVAVKNKVFILVATVLAVAVIDQLSKALIMRYMYEGRSFGVVSGLFSIVHIKNPGAAFGILAIGGALRTIFLVAVSLGALVVIFALIRQAKDLLTAFSLSLIAGGAIGNLIDRLRFGSVVDFLDFYIKAYHWPAFNIADSAITVGAALAFVCYYILPHTRKQG
ncbi:MAG: signal peptidase II [Deltaproteobacteria bacterium]|nr:signal peptidase II [Deltaproteobacteria bacterium]